MAGEANGARASPGGHATPTHDDSSPGSESDSEAGGLENRWIMDSGCSRHMTGNDKWFSSLTPMRTKEYIVFGDNGRGKVRGLGTVRVSDRFILREYALVSNLGFNLLSVS